jgi:hypothetical protein
VSGVPSMKKLAAGWVVVPNTSTVSFAPTLIFDCVQV